MSPSRYLPSGWSLSTTGCNPRQPQHYVAAMEAHYQALVRGDAGYVDPTSGLFVQTARTLWDRGTCCDQGCRHCPYADR